MFPSPTVFIVLIVTFTFSSAEFEDHFKQCHPDISGFDACIREALNAVRPYFKTGVDRYNIPPFDPFFAREVSASRGMPNFGFTLTLRNVTESGWSASKVTKFVSDLPNHKIVYTQSFPEKALTGSYEFNAGALGTSYNNRGRFTLTLYDLVQTTTITKEPGRKIQVRVNVETIGDLKLHITNLFFGRQVLEGFIDTIINGAWQPGFVVTRGLINDLVSTAFTEIFGNAFRNFPFESLIVPRSRSN